MKTLIINPPAETGFERSGRWPSKSTGGACQEPLFLAYAAAVLEKNNLDVELIDCRPEYISLEELLKKATPGVGLIVIQTSTPSIDLDLVSARALKEKNNNILIALVGPHPAVFDREILAEHFYVDIIIRGEYDYTIRDLAREIELRSNFKEIKGITYRRGSEIIRNESAEPIANLDELPYPARHFLPLDKYFEPLFVGRPTLRLISSRGCPFHCTFCAWPQMMYGHAFRARNPIKVADEIEFMKKEYKIKEYYFDDDTFTIDARRVNAICDEIIRRKINLPFECLARVNTVTPELLKKMKLAGCRVIRYGVESASPDILKNINKQITVEQIISAFRETKQAGIKTHATIMFGLPGETEETIKETIKFVLELNPDYAQFPIAIPYPGTEFYKLVKDNGWLKSDNWADYTGDCPIVQYPDLSREKIAAASKLALKKFYLRPKYVFKKIKQARSAGELAQLFKSGINLLRNL
ncbi:B12-binding domain-containing radical SAM protein [bacterium (Candidatus Gribaldobacteria) CG_4_10_14_0_2_um_filter_41_16]|uniref:B12-binding domain-containing radical SAM protein n=1 Tax=bacterium (Candidatus Gribaldobacteria) CG_4_10_14_0_2_um_filter_41_16 TaxID=2014265 RepID=A0A2M7VIC4_9BACT|nr:MAG: B12-binding domain-containing radical SAM protein [bacterium (Candidatus Gribaldobacteria) CG_4_10_14_0_2_um_filter_41_16]